MAFDDKTRARLQKLVTECRGLLTDEFRIQVQQTYGLDPSTGEVTPLERLTHLSAAEREAADLLRQTLAHYLASEGLADSADHRVPLIDRIVREQAFTVLNRLAALLTMEARGVLLPAVSQGQQSKAFELYKVVAGSALGETGEAYQAFLFSLFDEFAHELPALFDRFAPQGRLFPREAALLQVLAALNHHEIQPLWPQDETIGWIYQYFNSKEERKAMRDASQAPRNSRELAVRNQFFTPRYVVEFLVDNTLGRLWFNATGGQTSLRERCQYLLVKPDEQPPAALRLRDPRTLKLLDPACGSMHFGLYAFDLFVAIYREAWDWEQIHGSGSLDTSTEPAAGFLPLCKTYADQQAYLRDVPRLVIEHNIYGVDIDPRAAQIASLALWLRAQRVWHDEGVKVKDRPQIGRGHVVAAIAPPAEWELRQQIAANLEPRDAELFEKTLHLLRGLPELGVLQQVERELPQLIRKVYLGTGADLFAQQEQESWQQAEARLHEALTDFARAAKSTYQGRLFAQDALQGLRLIDLCREVFDVVVMNPPFGALSLGTKEYLTEYYPDSRNDLLGIFVDRGLGLLRRGGRLGAITSRTCFFLTSFTEWREKVVLGHSGVDVIADLGQGVMDDAMVEAAAYVLERGAALPATKVIRAIADDDRYLALNGCVENHRKGLADTRLFKAERKTFDLLPDSPFVYWVDAETIKQFDSEERFEPSVGNVRQGLATGDDPRFVRAVWEVAPKDTQFCYYPTNEEAFCSFDDPVVQAYFRRRAEGTPRWAFHVKAGASQPWYSPITLKINWHDRGLELRNFTDGKGKLRSRPQNIGFYYRPGFSWTRRAVRFYPYVIPSNCIPSVSRYMAFPDPGREAEALGVCASRLASAFMRFYAEFWQRPNFLVENVKMLPWPPLTDESKEYFTNLITGEVEKRRQAYQNFEPFHEFVLPAKICDYSGSGTALAFDRHSLIGEKGERFVADAYGFTPKQAGAVERDLIEAIVHQHGAVIGNDEGESSDEDSDFVLDTSAYATEEAHNSYLLGCAFGRWDIRFATGERQPEPLADPFAPLPVCPPGMLQNEIGLPALEHELPVGYPLVIPWSGVLVEDEGHPGDIVEQVRNALRVIWRDRADAIEEGSSAQLGTKSLRDYFRRSSGFFADHLKRYTKSNRKAPIYWPLSTTSGTYTLWFYYPRVTSQTLYTAINDFVEPKLKQVGADVAALRNKGSVRTRDDEKQLETLQTFELELFELRDTLLKLAPTYKPNHDDGVQISAAPLWPLFHFKPWQKVLKDTWAKLQKGDYDWAHLAMAYWPDRVREKCKTDKSLAIAHGLEELYVEPEAAPKKTRGRKKADT
ncbi:BREX-1 system adenine-specific DNA-methyltransferase PglX [Paraburkholderia phenoliruptrix]|uniref:BREX-1 system adenine-specific DNA-methyltransferase PglX n=1 Tax=Paraburkholderia phenoliruptrix TaxID=252970 RepID=UPI001C6EFB48|nr:BREX-1 system adenine-specific DNA-methyltransferase PglX [Paraburkholderia phenoliruptrix]MBW9106094.1 BREX-1 system adenine-specific DNA-methyltransferase PglX [Paraburkholderia phenoliruptrix]MBW9130972.1 BREX-1 system adenine-specific DNA-methyltransferase PglX [Paraburkholderia ginsengiterrae]